MPPKRGKGRGRGAPRQEEDTRQAGRGRGRRDEQEFRRPDEPQEKGAYVAPQARPAPEIYRPPSARGRPPIGPGDSQQRGGERQGTPAEEPVRRAPPPATMRQPEQPQPPQQQRPGPQQPPRQQQQPRPQQQQLPPQVSKDVAELSKAVAKIEIKPKSKFKMAARPGYGQNGRRIDLIANYLLLRYKDVDMFHYDVDITFLQARRKEDAATGGPKGKSMPKKGTSILTEGRTAKEAAEKKVSHVEHQLKRAPGKQRCREIFSQMLLSERLQEYYPVYDGQKNVYTIKKLPIGEKKSFKVTLEEEDRYKDFEIIVKPVEKHDGTNVIQSSRLFDMYEGKTDEVPQEVIMVFDTVMNHRNPPLSQCNVGRSFFLLNQNPYRLGDGLEIWYGYNQSVRLTERGPAVIVNFSAKAFHKSGSVIEYANEILSSYNRPVDITKLPGLDRRQINVLEEKLKKVKVQVTHLPYPRKYTIKNVTTQPARELRLDMDGRRVSVAEYFAERYRQLRYGHLPCLHMQSTNKTTYLPFEVCTIMPNQPVLGKLDGQTTSNMIRQTAIPPTERFNKIAEQIRDVKKYSGEAMKYFNLFMEVQFLELSGRVIPAPALTYKPTGREPPVVPPDQRGTWRMDGKQFLKSIESCSWTIISFANPRFCGEDTLGRLADTLCRSARSVGFNLEQPRDIRVCDHRTRTYDALRKAKEMGVTFALVVLSPRDNMHSYDEVKFFADIKLRLITQCMDETVVSRKFNPQVATNVLLKINSKVGGVNHSIAQRHMIFSRPVIIFGADAAHSPRGYNCPSIAAVVGSLDAYPSQYAVTCRTQSNVDEKKLSQEVILDLKSMVEHILTAFKNNTRGKNPEKVIFFRDGVSEGQFSIVLENEVPMVQRACYEVLGFVPPLTFIIVQKRHQTRFRPKNPRDGIGKMGNVPPGTTVDSDVVHPVFFDFFICSHEGIQGTSKPAHYTVLFDENKFNADELQQLCYHLCHMYVRCNRSISIPAPVMYAHLACARAKKYADLHIRQMGDQQSMASSGSSGEQRLPEEVERAINDMGTFVPGMFYV